MSHQFYWNLPALGLPPVEVEIPNKPRHREVADILQTCRTYFSFPIVIDEYGQRYTGQEFASRFGGSLLSNEPEDIILGFLGRCLSLGWDPGRVAISRGTGLSEWTVRKTLKKLKANGLVRQHDTGGYKVHFGDWESDDEAQ